ncbi:hypothetical protein F5050DRAFT_1711306 [Lentinula boryana]|uniref:Alcohol dehydrogenase-like N-terminal domain-containing protein n=1 Tax=Lentinula boryana TaxID=40481 RepID=A0ABQ8QGA5_9AGAR|nr:hypothetical protein F5050DRAFT_1711306 [Lentinula boryana]
MSVCKKPSSWRRRRLLFVLKTVPIPKPGPGEVLVKARDPFAPNAPYPAIIGFDIAGDVEEIGECVEGFYKGYRVFFELKMSTNESAGYQQCAAAPVILDTLTYAQAASTPLTFTTGLNPTFDDKVTFPREAALVVGASTSVGQHGYTVDKSAKIIPAGCFCDCIPNSDHLSPKRIDKVPNDLPGIVDGLKKDEVGGVKLVVFPLRS